MQFIWYPANLLQITECFFHSPLAFPLRAVAAAAPSSAPPPPSAPPSSSSSSRMAGSGGVPARAKRRRPEDEPEDEPEGTEAREETNAAAGLASGAWWWRRWWCITGKITRGDNELDHKKSLYCSTVQQQRRDKVFFFLATALKKYGSLYL